MTTIKYNRFYLSCALALTVALFLIGGQKSAGEVFRGQMHWIAHFVTYAIIAAFYVRSLPGVAALLIGCLVAAIGGLHEAYEIVGHEHAFEFGDFLVNAFGAFVGAHVALFWPFRSLTAKR